MLGAVESPRGHGQLWVACFMPLRRDLSTGIDEDVQVHSDLLLGQGSMQDT